MSASYSDAQRDALQALANLVPKLEDPDLVFSTPPEEGSALVCDPTYSEIATAFMELIYTHRDGIDGPLDWPSWKEDNAQLFYNLFNGQADAIIHDMEFDQIWMILTAIVRQDRFASGTLACAQENGICLALANRASELLIES